MNISIDKGVLEEIFRFTDAATKTEIGGLGFARRDGENIHWFEAFIVPQRVHAGAVTFNPESFEFAMNRAEKAGWYGRDDLVWASWHSHWTHDTYWSPVDEEIIRSYAKFGIPYLLSFVVNRFRHRRLRFDLFNNNCHGFDVPQVIMDDLRFQTTYFDPDKDTLTEMERLVEIQKFVEDPRKKKRFGGLITSTKSTKKRSELSADEQDALAKLQEEGYTYSQAADLLELRGEELIGI